ncbi:MAG: hypothetical protein JF606_15480 [Burkholderiales bacterium]|jgi:hypothetical protein|nr:hypothetical protein [Burkholderiales bacterium]
MTLDQYQALKLWHARHSRDHPIEKDTWDIILTLWMSGWVGGAVAMVLSVPLATVACIALLFLPRTYCSVPRYAEHKTASLAP